ncbi:tyrosine-protein phosphatase [Granulibacter bethesdensis]|uniref:Protein tyrosine phosphatase n=1 Tax=Granulibacter bethesdensis (strain ATCC BAA-1260 / CGDNIH1) TaxID=391165 RepID=Q0BU45_GRABC|nr:tyrosine-protein phosphatase [Granulibacter bethesdensis]ABI61657.1 Protein tyrosine phosphatase [Granulibacter bethesdensis CGDNIH1]AHJ69525.1 Protein tyrosine phosphatase [Granulibacter bethesdensis]APH51462.1 Protein tyrosine phosphatase [Granulibacter bethesdensis]APH64155.1 Protein tyrosine phosphatase [Granulibacter bethesdensis]
MYAHQQVGTLPRQVSVEAAHNFRDLGGWSTRLGGKVRFGRVFRSAAIPADRDNIAPEIAALNLKAVCDFRSESESAVSDSVFTHLPGVTVHRLPINPAVGGSIIELLTRGAQTGEDISHLLRRAYIAYALEWGPSYRGMFDLLLQNDIPLLLHCSIGKDRTGFGAALILRAVGVRWDDILEDYLATNQLWEPDQQLLDRVPRHARATLLNAHEEMLHAAFEAIRLEYGSIERYFERALGLTALSREKLCDLLVS